MEMDWLPPLNSHDDDSSYIAVYPYSFSDPDINEHPCSSRRIIIHVTVDFYDQSDLNFRHPFHGFKANQSHQIHLPTLESTLRHCLRDDHDLFPFLFDYPCIWTEYDGIFNDDDDDPLRLIHERECVYSDGELADKIYNFALDMEDDKAVGIYIARRVMVPAEEFRSWVDWYEDRKRANPSFAAEYARAIRRPRDGGEIYEEIMAMNRRRRRRSSAAAAAAASVSSGVRDVEATVINAGGADDDDADEACCIICFEEFGENVVALKLACGHFFHSQCIARWLRENDVCPLCRREVHACLSLHE